MPARFTLSKDKAGKFRFTLYAPNGQVVAESRTYATKASAMNGVASVRKNATIAAFEDATSSATRSAGKPAAKKTAAKKETSAKAAASARRTGKSATTAAKKAAKPAARKAPAKPAAAPRKRVPTPRPAITV